MPESSDELHHIPFIVTVKLKKEMDSENIFNEVKGNGKRVSVVAPPPAAAPNQPEQYPQSDNSMPPWKRS